MNRTTSFAHLALAALLGALLVTLFANGTGQPSITALAAPPQNPSTAASCDTGRSIQVSGAATVNVVPDRALVRLGVHSTAGAPDQAQAINQAAIERVITALRQLPIAEKDIATDVYMITPVYNGDGLTISGYRAENIVAVTLRDINQVSVAVVAAFKAGANSVNNVEFYTSELRRYRDQARELATKAAKEKALALADAAGTRTGCVLTITENSWASYSGWWGRNAAQWTQNVVQNAPSAGEPAPGETPVSVGQIAIRAEVNVRFSLE